MIQERTNNGWLSNKNVINNFKTLVDVIKHQSKKPDIGITFINSADNEVNVSYQNLLQKAKAWLSILRQNKIKKGDEAVFQISDTESFIILFWACIIGGIIPVPLTTGNNDEHRLKLFKVLDTLNSPCLVISNEFLIKLETHNPEEIVKIRDRTLVVEDTFFIQDNSENDKKMDEIIDETISPDDIAFIQFSSGSTGTPKGVVLTHKNLITNLTGIIYSAKMTEKDSFFSWMPLTHDMGLIGMHLVPITLGIKQHIMPTVLFIRRPVLWFKKLNEHKATITSSPNFGYSYFFKFFKPQYAEDWDLSHIRLIFNGAEPISSEVCKNFLDAMEKYGLKKTSMYTVYGLAEASLAVAFPEVDKVFKTIYLNRNSLGLGEKIETINSDDRNAFSFVIEGYPVKGTTFRITDDDGNILPENYVGHIEINGDNVTSCYYNNEEATKSLIKPDGWLDTGDLGVIIDDQLVVTGRLKDIIFANGQNYYSHDLERIIENIEGVESGHIVATGVQNKNIQEDELVLFLIYKKKEYPDFVDISETIKKEINLKTGLKVTAVVPVRKIPKTTSGKVQRFKLAGEYINGDFDEVLKEIKILTDQNYSYEEPQINDVQSKNSIKSSIAELIEKLVGYKITDFNKSLVELGIESIKAPKFQIELEKTFNMPFPVSIVFDYPTINKITEYIYEKQNAQFITANDTANDKIMHDYEPIAVIGMSCRTPGDGDNLDKFWNNLINEVDCISEIPESRWDADYYYNKEKGKNIVTKNGGFINNIEMFDPVFFQLTPAEASFIDPQQRLLIELTWEALENAGLNIKKLEGSNTSVFTGISSNDYSENILNDEDNINKYAITGLISSSASGRISYNFGFKGPSASIDTACSSSLVTIHMGVKSLQNKESDISVASGVNLILSPKGHIGLTGLDTLSPDGRCKSFDDSANGYVRSEGAGVVILKRLSDAQKDGDPIIAVIKGSAINHNGRGSGLTVPNGVAQEDVIKKALKLSKLSIDDIDYIEAHGSATKLGDPQEMNALFNIFNNRKKTLLVGSVKSNIGHTESAAGILGFIKSALSLQKGIIPASIHVNKPNTLIDWDNIPIKVASASHKFENAGTIGISSFGISGTNAHIILQGHEQESQNENKNNWTNLLTFSAKKDQNLFELIPDYIEYLKKTNNELKDICYTSNISRSILNKRAAVSGRNKEEIISKLENMLINKNENILLDEKKETNDHVYIFSGEIINNYKNIKQFYENNLVFKTYMDKCDRLFNLYSKTSINKILFSQNTDGYIDNYLHKYILSFAVNHSIFKFLKSCNINLNACSGYGFGEINAACASGIMRLKTGVKIISAFKKILENKYKELPPFYSENYKKHFIEIKNALGSIELHNASIPVFSFNPDIVDSEHHLNIDYWLKHLDTPYDQSKVFKELHNRGYNLFLEIGNSNSQINDYKDINLKPNVLSFFYENMDLVEQLEYNFIKLYLNNFDINWESVHSGIYYNKVILPNYKFNKKPYWIDKPQNYSSTNKNILDFQNDTQNQNYSKINIDPALLNKEIKNIVCYITGLAEEDISNDTDMFTLGLDSLMLVEFRKKINEKFNTDIPLNDFLSTLTTIQKISDHIIKNKPSGEFTQEETFKSDQMDKTNTADNNSIQFQNNNPGQNALSLQVNAPSGSNELNKIISMQIELMNKQLEIYNKPGIEHNNQNINTAQMNIANKKQRPELPEINFRALTIKEDNLTKQQKDFISDFAKKFNNKTKQSKLYNQNYRNIYSHWLSSLNFRMSIKELIYPLIAHYAKDQYLWDIDGNKYIDIAMGYGVHYFGHRPDFIIKEINNQMNKHFVLSPHSDLLHETASLFNTLTGTERVAFCNTGSEAVMFALRIARTVTKRKKIVRFSGSYHGVYDGVLGEADAYGTFPFCPGITEASVEDTIILQYGSGDSIEKIKELKNEIACILVEPVQSRRPGFQPKNFLKQLRSLTEEFGIVLIFDEMITGFRIHPGGAQHFFGIKADIITYGKIVGGGMPIGIVAGKKEYLNTVDGGPWNYGDNSYPASKATFTAGTFANHPLTLAASKACLKFMVKHGESVQEKTNRRTENLVNNLNSYFNNAKVPIVVKNFGSLFRFESFGKYDLSLTPIEMDLFFYLLMERGVYTWERRICFLSTAHTDQDIEYIFNAVKDSIKELRRNGFTFSTDDNPPDPDDDNDPPLDRSYLKSDIKPSVKFNDSFSLASPQNRIFLLNQISGGEKAYHITNAYLVRGKLDNKKVEFCIKALIDRHPALRTGIYVIDDKVVQEIHDDLEPEVIFDTCSLKDIPDYIENNIKAYDLSKPPLMRIYILEIEAGLFIMVFDFHHIVVDGFSLNIIADDFIKIYEGNTLEPIKLQYKDFVEWEKKYFFSDNFKKQEKYWLEQFSEEIPVLNLPLDYTRPEIRSFEGSTVKFEIDTDLTNRIKQFAKNHRASFYMVLLSIYYVFLNKLTGDNDIVIGTPVAVRGEKDFEKIAGMFTNTMALRNNCDDKQQFIEFLNAVKYNCISAYSNQEYPFDMLVNKLELKRDMSRNPIFDTAFVYEYAENRVIKLSDVEFSPYNMDLKYVVFDLTLEMLEENGKLNSNFSFSTKLFKKETVENWVKYLKTLILNILKAPEEKIMDIDIVPEEEKQKILQNFNNTNTDYPSHKPINLIFDEIADKYPDKIALSLDKDSMTYKELKENSNKISNLLRHKDVKPEVKIGLMVNISFNMIAGIFGILKSGGAYVPLDAGFPDDRIKYIIEDSDINIILANEEFSQRLINSGYTGEIITFESSELKDADITTPEPINQSDNLAYVIYTSGSTGNPKGTLINHYSVNRVVLNTNYIDITEEDNILQLSSYVFDGSVFDIYGALLNGARLVLIKKDDLLDISNLAKKIKSEKISIFFITTALFNTLVDYDVTCIKNIKKIMFGGEKASVKHARKALNFLGKNKIYNVYGPTESTVYATYYPVDDLDNDITNIPIGYPLSNTRLYVLDKNLKIVPIGVPGELCIAGDGLSRGYLNRPDLTSEKFIKNPYNTNEKIYRTGDLVRWLPDGSIEFLGRIDFQVKIRGFRIEPGEIESYILKYPELNKVIVICKNDEKNNKYLCAYFTAEKELKIKDIKDFLLKQIPGYMVPAFFIQLDKMPLTINGKINRKALPEPDKSAVIDSDNYTAPEKEIEKTIAGIWQEVLGLENIGIRDNFFELGGTSITIIEVNNKLNRTLNIEIPVTKLFQYPTIESLLNNLQEEKILKTDSVNDSNIISDIEKTIGIKNSNLKPKDLNSFKNTDIAVIGMAGRFPGAGNIKDFWDNLVNGVESIKFFSDEELLEAGISPDTLKNPNYVKAKGVLANSDFFDASFFGYSNKEAGIMDPQIRIFHECVYEALENAGYSPEKFDGNIGLYAGASPNPLWEAKNLNKDNMSEIFENMFLADKDFLTTRIAYKLNLKGPAYTIQTACSTSLVAVDLACKEIISGKCDIALAGGVSIIQPSINGYIYQDGMIMSPDGHCRAFDKNGHGIVDGQGAGVVVLKSFENAIADGDYIYSVIKGSSTNNDGNDKVAYTAPSVNMQKNVIKSALQTASIEPETIGYIEAHGTATELGDPIEIQALKEAFYTEKKNYCKIGSVKTNIGHLDAAAGVTGLIKTSMILQNKIIPASLHFKEPNPKINFSNSPFIVNNELSKWENTSIPFRAGVSAFGMGGTNAHVIMEEADNFKNTSIPKPANLILLSAKTKKALETKIEQLNKFLKENPYTNLSDIAYTLQTGRTDFDYRYAFVCTDIEDASKKLDTYKKNPNSIIKINTDKKNICFLFTGQGAQYINMAKGLYDNIPFFKEYIDKCLDILNKISNRLDYREILFSNLNDSDKINETIYAQPLLFIIEYSLAMYLIYCGITPNSMIGHSLGEYVAACVSGLFTLEDALRLIVKRSELMQNLPSGEMLSVNISKEELLPLINENLSIAAHNSTSFCVVSGTHEHIKEFQELIDKKNYNSILLKTSHAYHSSMIDPILEDFKDEAAKVNWGIMKIPFISNLHGEQAVYEKVSTPEYWVNHMRNTVNFYDGAKKLLEKQDIIFLELGPGKTLTTLMSSHDYKTEAHNFLNLIRHPMQKECDYHYFLDKIGSIWTNGKSINWKNFYFNEKRFKLPLPAYPFNPVQFKADNLNNTFQLTSNNTDILKTKEISDWFYTPVWSQSAKIYSDIKSLAGKKWLILSGSIDISDKISDLLKTNNNTAIVIKNGNQFIKVDNNNYIINFQEPSDFEKLYKELKELDLLPDKILHTSCLSEIEQRIKNGITLESAEILINQTFYGLIYLLQSFGADNRDMELNVITNNMSDVIGDEIYFPEQAVMLSLVKIIPIEYQNFKARNIDLDFSSNIKEEKLINQIYNEINSEIDDISIAFRGKNRWTQDYKSMRITDNPENSNLIFKDNGVYLIAGGLGGLGSIMAENILSKVKAKLVLFGRTELPGQQDWDRYLAENNKNDSVYNKITRLKNLMKSGSEIEYINVDISDKKKMTGIIKNIKQKYKNINGFIHCAGDIDTGGIIHNRSKQKTDEIIGPKIMGTIIFNELIDDLNPDFFIMFSSLGNLLYKVKFGESGYNAANEFLDHFASYKNNVSTTFTVTINWCDWENIGLSARINTDKNNSDEYLLKNIKKEEGIEVFNRIIINDLSRIAVVKQDLNIILEKINDLSSQELKSGLKSDDQNNIYQERPELSVEYTAPDSEIEKYIADVWKEVLGITPIGTNDNFFDLGGDSLKVITTVSKLQTKLDINLDNFYNNPTITEIIKIVSYKDDNLDNRFEKVKNMFKTRYNKEIEFKKSKDYDSEMKVYNERISAYDKLNVKACKNYKNILLTGSTGYLGSYLLRDLLTGTDSTVSLLVRGETPEKAEQRFVDKFVFYFDKTFYNKYKKRLKIVQGDFTRENLGMPQDIYEKLANEVDCIINSAAMVSHFGKYNDFYKTNVSSVDNIIKFASKGIKKDIKHISTMFIFSDNMKNKKHSLFTEFDLNMGQVIHNNYLKTKYEAEELLHKAMSDGYNVSIFRVGNLMFNSKNGRFQNNIGENALYMIIKSLIKLQVTPKSGLEFDFSYIDYVSKAIIHLFNRENLLNETYHIYNPHIVNLGSSLTTEATGVDIQNFDINEFIDVLKNNYTDQDKQDHIKHLLSHLDMEDISLTEKERGYVKMVCDKTTKILEKLDFSWIKVNKTHIKKMLAYCKEVKFL